MILKIIVVVIVLGAGVLTGSWMIGQPIISPSDIQGLGQNIWSYIQQHWLAIAGSAGSAVGGLAILGSKIIGRKNEAINTLGQTVVQKDRDINYLETQLHSEGTIEAFKEKYGEDAFTKIETLSAELTQTKATIEAQKTEITNWEDKETQLNKSILQLKGEKQEWIDEAKRLEYALGVKKGEIKLPVR